MMLFSKRLALVNYSLAAFLATPKKKDKIKPLTRYFFAFELGYFLGIIAMAALGTVARLGHRFGDQVLIGILVVIIVLVTQAHGEYLKNMQKAGVFNEYDKLNDKQRARYAWLGALVFIGSFALIFVFGVLFFEGYGDLNRIPGRL